MKERIDTSSIIKGATFFTWDVYTVLNTIWFIVKPLTASETVSISPFLSQQRTQTHSWVLPLSSLTVCFQVSKRFQRTLKRFQLSAPSTSAFSSELLLCTSCELRVVCSSIVIILLGMYALWKGVWRVLLCSVDILSLTNAYIMSRNEQTMVRNSNSPSSFTSIAYSDFEMTSSMSSSESVALHLYIVYSLSRNPSYSMLRRKRHIIRTVDLRNYLEGSDLISKWPRKLNISSCKTWWQLVALHWIVISIWHIDSFLNFLVSSYPIEWYLELSHFVSIRKVIISFDLLEVYIILITTYPFNDVFMPAQ